MDDFRFGVEAGRGEGLGLRLKSVWSTFGLEFHRGLWSFWDRAGRADRVPGIGVDEDFEREGEALRESEIDPDPEFFRESCEASPCGMLAYLRELAGRDVLFETTLLRRLERLMTACKGSPLVVLVGSKIGDEAGELLGVSTALPVAERSIDTIVEIESRSC